MQRVRPATCVKAISCVNVLSHGGVLKRKPGENKPSALLSYSTTYLRDQSGRLGRIDFIH